jgi:hypothetical protein
VKNKDLIARLQTLDPELDVICDHGDEVYNAYATEDEDGSYVVLDTK